MTNSQGKELFTPSRRAILGLAAMSAVSTIALSGAEARSLAQPRKVGSVPTAICIVPHPDDELYSMWPMLHLMGQGYNVHFVYATRGEVTPTSLKLDGSAPCSWHGYTHNPDKENYTIPTKEEIGFARLNEGKSAIGAMSMISPGPGIASTGIAYWHEENLGSQYGCDGCGSSTAPVTPGAIDAAEVVIRKYIALYPGSFVYTMSPTDDHPDHAALGHALRRLKGTPIYDAVTHTFTFVGGDPILGPSLKNAMFFASKLYWGNATTPRAPDLLAEYCAWYPNYYPNNNSSLTRMGEYAAWLRKWVAPAYMSWNPAQGSFAIGGGHSTASQMYNCITNPAVGIAALWHP